MKQWSEVVDHRGQGYFNFDEPSKEPFIKPSFEEEYLTIPGESRVLEEGERAVSTSEGIKIVNKEMRTLFFESEGWYAPDNEVLKWYNKVFDVDEWAKTFDEVVKKFPIGISKLPTEEKQVGGNHYKNMAITPTKYIEANNISWSEGNVIKYISRHGSKNGRQDVEKALHYCELILKGYDEAERLTSLTN